jgi:hypothetical protein
VQHSFFHFFRETYSEKSFFLTKSLQIKLSKSKRIETKIQTILKFFPRNIFSSEFFISSSNLRRVEWFELIIINLTRKVSDENRIFVIIKF